ncbi:alpha/beta hydrolase [Longispora sp. K20-0274]|uniref:alpha/beta hydrolase fold domain-containing protein n=1 Tax=Longispora sp. K20-0274 TaxID=3088255 RepID=UPI00399C244E
MKLDVKLPDRAPAGTRPAVVWVHGGGWNLGDRGEAPMWHRWLNDRGYAVFAIDYRLAPPARWDQAPGDVRCAVGWVKAHAERYQVDPGRVMLIGGSAGGNLALMGAYADERVKPSCDVGDTSVRAVAAFYPATDVAGVWRDSGFPNVRGWAENYTGGTPEQQPEHYRLASPVGYVRPGLPPTLLMHGERDHIVPYPQSPELAARLTAAGVANELVSIPYAEHIFDFAWGSWGTQICRHTLAEFLARYFPAGP